MEKDGRVGLRQVQFYAAIPLDHEVGTEAYWKQLAGASPYSAVLLTNILSTIQLTCILPTYRAANHSRYHCQHFVLTPLAGCCPSNPHTHRPLLCQKLKSPLHCAALHWVMTMPPTRHEAGDMRGKLSLTKCVPALDGSWCRPAEAITLRRLPRPDVEAVLQLYSGNEALFFRATGLHILDDGFCNAAGMTAITCSALGIEACDHQIMLKFVALSMRERVAASGSTEGGIENEHAEWLSLALVCVFNIAQTGASTDRERCRQLFRQTMPLPLACKRTLKTIEELGIAFMDFDGSEPSLPAAVLEEINILDPRLVAAGQFLAILSAFWDICLCRLSAEGASTRV